MTAKIDMTGYFYGLWTIVREIPARRDEKVAWLCRCVCGTVRVVCGQSLRSGQSKSCGCLRSEVHRGIKTKHGKSGTAEYRAWCGMRDRCYNSNLPNHFNYGGRGISVCARWRKSFEAFFADVGPRPSRRHSLERRNTNGNYEPKNCCWATRSRQNANTRRARTWIVNGRKFNTAAAAARALRVTPSTIIRRCNGHRQYGYFFPPRDGYSSVLKYGVVQ